MPYHQYVIYTHTFLIKSFIQLYYFMLCSQNTYLLSYSHKTSELGQPAAVDSQVVISAVLGLQI
jgi:hypothetical protein